MTAREEAAALRGVMESIVTITATATDPIAKAACELARQGLDAAERVSVKRDQARARWREWDRRRKQGDDPPDKPGPAFDPRLQDVCNPFATGNVSPPDPPPKGGLSLVSSSTSSLTDSGDLLANGLRAHARENGTNGEAPAFVLEAANAQTNANKRARKRNSESLPADPQDPAAWEAWCAKWKLDARSADVVTFANWHLGKEITWRHWGRAWLDWQKKPKRQSAQGVVAAVPKQPAGGKWEMGDGK